MNTIIRLPYSWGPLIIGTCWLLMAGFHRSELSKRCAKVSQRGERWGTESDDEMSVDRSPRQVK